MSFWNASISTIRRAHRTAVFWSLFSTGLRFGGIGFVLPLILHNLNPGELGLWYIFLALGGFASLLDLGMGATATRAVSYLWAGAQELRPDGYRPSGKSEDESKSINLPLFSDLCVTLRRFYGTVAGVICVVLGLGGGVWIWIKTQGMVNAVEYRWAWAFYIGGLCYASYNAIWALLLCGINGIRQAQQSFAVSLLCNYSVTIICLKLGFGLWAVVLGNFVQGWTERLISRQQFQLLAGPIAKQKGGVYKKDILSTLAPQSWRTCASSFGTYVTLYSGTLVYSSIADLGAVASYGLSLQLCLALVQVAGTPLLVKLPLINHLRVQGNIRLIAKIMKERISIFWILIFAGSFSILTFGDFMVDRVIHSKTHLLSGWHLVLLLLFVILEANQGLFREIMFTSNRNPYFISILVSGVVILLLSFLFAPFFGLQAILIVQVLVPLLWNNWWIPKTSLASLKTATD